MKRLIVLVLVLLLCIPVPMVRAATCAEFAAPMAVAQLDDPRWAGISGMTASTINPGAWWVHNDRGMGRAEAGKFYGITSSGQLLREWSLYGVSSLENQGLGAVDMEDIAIGPGPGEGPYLYIGDIGGNRYTPWGRTSVRLFRMREPKLDVSAGTQPPVTITDFTILTLHYPDDLRYDAETLMVDTNGDIYIVTKDSSAGQSKVFYVANLPRGQKTATMTLLTTIQFGVGYLAGSGYAATGGAISPRGNEAVIRTYNKLVIWQKEGTWAETFSSGVPCKLPSASPQQYEAVAFDRKGVDIYDTFETNNGDSTIQRYTRNRSTMQLPMILR